VLRALSRKHFHDAAETFVPVPTSANLVLGENGLSHQPIVALVRGSAAGSRPSDAGFARSEHALRRLLEPRYMAARPAFVAPSPTDSAEEPFRGLRRTSLNLNEPSTNPSLTSLFQREGPVAATNIDSPVRSKEGKQS